MNIITKTWNTFHVLEIQGRIDGLTAADLKRSFDQHTAAGRQKLILDFSGVTFMSSAGLRVIIHIHKSLKPIGGELVLIAVPVQVREVFRVSGMDPFLTIFPDFQPLMEKVGTLKADPTIHTIEIEGMSFEWRPLSDQPGKCFLIGDPGKINNASFEEKDNIMIRPSEITYGTGLAALGEVFGEYQSLYGESVVIGHHFFSYPAVEKPMVDFSYNTPDSDQHLNFLYGLGINGKFSGVLRFESFVESPDFTKLIHLAGKMATTPCFAVVIMGTSCGIQWMHLKKPPVLIHHLSKGSIFDSNLFHDWMNFSPEEDDLNKTIIACGIASQSAQEIPPGMKRFFPKEGNMHLHAAVFENGLWSNNIVDFEPELLRIAREFEVEKVVHLLPVSRLKTGYIGIINLENN
ncbi:MAG: STAS domain-containing protein [Bacteroidales bacterium]|nr:STAS domain-containing protein [Bacteroidales bacterium]